MTCHMAYVATGTLGKGVEYHVMLVPVYGPHHFSMQRPDPHPHGRKAMHVVVPDLPGWRVRSDKGL